MLNTFDKKPTGRNATHLFSLVAALQQVSRLVVLQVADARISPSSQQQLQDLLLVGVAVKTGSHV